MRNYIIIHQSSNLGTAFPPPHERPVDMATWMSRHQPSLWSRIRERLRDR